MTVAKTGTGAGAVTSLPAGIDCGALCSASFDLGSTIGLDAAPMAGSVFSGWSGAGCTGTGGCQVLLSEAATVTAAFSSVAAPLPIAPLTPVCRVPNARSGASRGRKGSTAKTGKVVKQNPKSGKVLAAGTKIKIVLGS